MLSTSPMPMTVRVPPFLPVLPVLAGAPPPLPPPPLSSPPPPQAATTKASTTTSGARVARGLRIRFLSLYAERVSRSNGYVGLIALLEDCVHPASRRRAG